MTSILIKLLMRFLFLSFFFIFGFVDLKACYAIIVGKNASFDGSVLLGHLEQNDGQLFCNFRVVPRLQYQVRTSFELQNGGKIPLPDETYSYFWSEIYGLNSSDAILNEHGVACVSNSTPTKEEKPEALIEKGEIKNGGIALELRLEVAKRAKTAKEGVQIIGELVEKFGYLKSGTTHIIADPNEAWIVSIVCGKRWVAQRVPDNQVVVLANVNIINEIDLSDTMNFLGSSDIIDYAIKKGWFNPKSSKKFNFKNAYDKPSDNVFNKKYNCDPRQWRGQCLITGTKIKLPVKKNLPFSVFPNKKISIQDIRNILSDHLEGTEFDLSDNYQKGCPHYLMNSGLGMICDNNVQEIAIFQLRNWLPREIGCIYWRATGNGCSGVLLPWYLGVEQTPKEYWKWNDTSNSLTMKFHYYPPKEYNQYDNSKAFFIFLDLVNLIDKNYKENIINVKQIWSRFEKELFDYQLYIEKVLVELYEEDKLELKKFLTYYCSMYSQKAIKLAKEIIYNLK